MFVFTLVAGFHDDVPAAAAVRAAMAGFPVAAADGVRLAESPRAAAGLARWAVVARDLQAQPSWDPDGGVLFAGDVRLYNRPELLRALGDAAPAATVSDLELARLAYLRWRDEAPRHLIGDFAFAAWDEGRRSLFAARDHLGVRPLHFRWRPRAVAVASDVRQLMPLLPRPSDEVDGEQILDRFTVQGGDVGRTFFRSIRRLRPGHQLVADDQGVREVRYWVPPAPPARPLSYADNCQRLREIFQRAVRDRIESDHPLVAHSSGGFDASTILMAADQVYRREPGRPPLITASGVAPGYPCDESSYMDAVAAATTFEGVRWSVTEGDVLTAPAVRLGAPVWRRGLAGGPPRDLALARERGARVLLGGTAGDDVLYAAGVLRDFARAGKWRSVLGHLAQRRSLGGQVRGIVDAALGFLDPPTALRLARRPSSRSVDHARWMGPALRDLRAEGARPSERADLDGRRWPSHLACGVWARLTGSKLSLVIDAAVNYAMDEGIEARLPYTDVRLIDHILTIPWEQRDPRGHLRRTGRDALGPLLPPVFAGRVSQQSWSDVVTFNSLRAVRAVSHILEAGPWRSAPFVDRNGARQMLDEVRRKGAAAGVELCVLVPELSALEVWLRGLLEYNAAHEVEICPIA